MRQKKQLRTVLYKKLHFKFSEGLNTALVYRQHLHKKLKVTRVPRLKVQRSKGNIKDDLFHDPDLCVVLPCRGKTSVAKGNLHSEGFSTQPLKNKHSDFSFFPPFSHKKFTCGVPCVISDKNVYNYIYHKLNLRAKSFFIYNTEPVQFLF